jgi:2-amino-4-hydroxy-6-hydroxymethyldihydropteridine diphosphokinase
MVVRIDTDLPPFDLLHTVKAIERRMGRLPKSDDGGYHDRLIDIDIILYGDVTCSSDELTLPHPLYRQRPFVLDPLNEIKNV